MREPKLSHTPLWLSKEQLDYDLLYMQYKPKFTTEHKVQNIRRPLWYEPHIAL